MDLNICLNKWIDHIVDLVSKNSRYQGSALNGFKNSKKGKRAYEWLTEYIRDQPTYFSRDFNLDPTNFEDVLYHLFIQSDPDEYNLTTFRFLNKSIKERAFIAKKLNTDQLIALTTKLNTATSSYDELGIEEPFESQSNNNGSSTIPSTSVAVNRVTQSQTSNENPLIIDATLTENQQSGERLLSSQSVFFNNEMTQQIRELKDLLANNYTDLKNQILNLNKLSNSYDNKTLNQLLELLGFRIRKKLLAEHALNVQNEYSNPINNSCPSQIQVDKFFIPYSFSTNFLTKMDIVLKETQDKIIIEIKEEINNRIKIIDEEILKIKTSLKRFKTEEEINKISDDSKRIEEEKLKKRFDKSLKKAKNNKRKSFLTHYKNKIDDDFLNNNSSNESSFVDEKSIMNITKNNTKYNSKSNNNKNSRSRSRSRSKSIIKTIKFQNNNHSNNHNLINKQKFNSDQKFIYSKSNNNYNYHNNHKSRQNDNYNNRKSRYNNNQTTNYDDDYRNRSKSNNRSQSKNRNKRSNSKNTHYNNQSNFRVRSHTNLKS